MTESKRLHQKLLIMVENELHPSMSQYRGVVAASSVYLPGGVVSSCQSAMDLLRALQNHGQIAVGKYTVLKEILEDSLMIALKNKVKDQEKAIQRALEVERLQARQEPTGRRTSRQPHYQSMAKQPESALFEGSESVRDDTVAKQPESTLFGSLRHELRQIPDVPGPSVRYEHGQNPTYARTSRDNVPGVPGPTGDETVAKQPESTLFGSQRHELRQIPDVPDPSTRYEQRQNPTLAETSGEDNVYRSSNIFRIVQRSDACKDWRSLGRELELEDAEFDAISCDFNQNLREQCYQMLRVWLQKSGKSATPKVLITALRNLEYNKAADEIMEYFIGHPLEL